MKVHYSSARHHQLKFILTNVWFILLILKLTRDYRHGDTMQPDVPWPIDILYSHILLCIHHNNYDIALSPTTCSFSAVQGSCSHSRVLGIHGRQVVSLCPTKNLWNQGIIIKGCGYRHRDPHRDDWSNLFPAWQCMPVGQFTKPRIMAPDTTHQAKWDIKHRSMTLWYQLNLQKL